MVKVVIAFFAFLTQSDSSAALYAKSALNQTYVSQPSSKLPT
jgi:hypothetical protein